MYEYSILLFPCLTCFFWFVFLICRWKRNYRSQNIFALNMLVMAVSFYVWNVYLLGQDDLEYFYRADIVEAFSTLSVYPLTYLYFKSLTDNRRFGWKDYLWFVPALMVGVSSAVLYGVMGEENAVGYVRELLDHGYALVSGNFIYRLHFWITVRAYNIVIFIQILYTLVYSFRALMLYRKRLNDFFSSLDGKSLRSNYVILISLIISCLFSLIIYNIGRAHFNDMPLVILLVVGSWGWVLNYLGFQVASLKYSADDLAADMKMADLEAEHEGYTGEGDTAGGETNNKRKIDPGLVLRFNRLVDNDKIYLQPELRLDTVARMMCTNRTYISRLLNEEYQCSFSDFINCKRIAYAQSLMRSNRQMSQEQIALASGFLHASSFCRIFKQYTGTTFREWQKKNLSAQP